MQRGKNLREAFVSCQSSAPSKKKEAELSGGPQKGNLASFGPERKGDRVSGVPKAAPRLIGLERYGNISIIEYRTRKRQVGIGNPRENGEEVRGEDCHF